MLTTTHAISERTTFFLSLVHKSEESIVRLHIAELRSLIRTHDFLYSVEAAPIISDGEYDALFALLVHREHEFPDLVSADSPTQQVAVGIQDWYTKAVHKVPMLSLKNTYNAVDIAARWESISTLLQQNWWTTGSYCVEPKLDGLSLEIVYHAGALTQAITRGDGYTGEDVTQQARCIHHIPLTIEARKTYDEVRVRGEVVMPKTAFEKVIAYQKDAGLPLFANPRNAAAWTLRQLDPQMIRKRGLLFYVHGLLWGSDLAPFALHSALLEEFTRVGFSVHPLRKTFQHLNEVIAHCEDGKFQATLDADSVECDGLVIKINERVYTDMVWSTAHHPRWAIAFKYPTKQVAAQLLDVHFQVGRTGVVTPVALLSPVELRWATVTKATLHNFDIVRERDIRKGDRVRVQRSGEVIPYIHGPITERRTWSETTIEIPQGCPSCQTPLVKKDEQDVARYCPSSTCPAKHKEQLRHFVSKECMHITWLGESGIDQLYDAGCIYAVEDIFALSELSARLQLRSLPWFGTKKIDALVKEIEAAKTRPCRRLLHGLSIQFVGKKVAVLLQKYVGQVVQKERIAPTALIEVLQDEEALLAIEWIGPSTVKAVSDAMRDPYMKERLAALEMRGVVCLLEYVAVPEHEMRLRNQIVVITGSFPVSREQVTQQLESKGAVVTGSVSKKTSFLLCGRDPWSKVEKAHTHKIPILSREEFLIRYPMMAQELPDGKQLGGLFG